MIANGFQKYLENFAFQLLIILQYFTITEIWHFLKKEAHFLTAVILFSVYK